jgi:hypothetical protein
MVEGIAGALGGAAAAGNSQSAGNSSSSGNRKTLNAVGLPPAKPSEVPFWAVGNSVGKVIASGILENNPDWKAAFGDNAESLSQLMQALMSDLTSEMTKSMDCLKDDDEEEQSYANLLTNQ